MENLHINQKLRLGKISLFATIAVAFVASALFLQTESIVHAEDTSKPVSADLGAITVNSGFAEMIEAVTPAVVSLMVTKKTPATYGRQNPGSDLFKDFRWDGPGQPPKWFWDFFQNNPFRNGPPGNVPRKFSGVGAGVIFDPNGLIVTNQHVIEHAAEIRVSLHDGQVFNAQVIGVDKWTDLAVLQIESDKPMPYAAFGDTEQVRVGDWAIAIGDPFGLSKSVSLGIVSAMDRNLNEDSPKVPLLQIDAAVNRGNSGGPLFNSAGEVIGINTMIISPSGASAGVGFAVPSSVVEDIVDAIESEGQVTRGWLGVGIQSVTPQIAGALDLNAETAHGALVASVDPGSPADNAGVTVGDIIVEFDGKKVEDIRSLSKLVKLTTPGSEVAILVLRDGKEMELRGTVETLMYADAGNEVEAVPTEDQNEGMIGASVATLTPTEREKYQIAPSVNGVVVTGVQTDSPAEKAGLKEGDIIVSINNKSVNSSQEASDAIQSAAGAGNSSALLLVADGKGEQLFVVVALS